jgi:hypothetical protein
VHNTFYTFSLTKHDEIPSIYNKALNSFKELIQMDISELKQNIEDDYYISSFFPVEVQYQLTVA